MGQSRNRDQLRVTGGRKGGGKIIEQSVGDERHLGAISSLPIQERKNYTNLELFTMKKKHPRCYCQQGKAWECYGKIYYQPQRGISSAKLEKELRTGYTSLA